MLFYSNVVFLKLPHLQRGELIGLRGSADIPSR